jgi:hypothetical protein
MQIRHATLLNVIGRPARQQGLVIIPAEVELAGSMFSSAYPLRDLPRDRIPPALRAPIEGHYDVAWVRARLPMAFGVTPEPWEGEKTFLVQGFVAVPEGAAEGVAFECSDYYGRTSLIFSDAEQDEGLKAKVASAFWSILLAEPDELADFSGRCFHLGTSRWLHFGCEDGEPYFRESDEGHDD